MGSFKEMDASATPTPLAETAATAVFCVSVVWLSFLEIRRYFTVGALHPASFGKGQPFAVGALFLALTALQLIEIRRSFTDGVAKLAAKLALGNGSIDFSLRTNPVGFWAAVGVQCLIVPFLLVVGVWAVVATR